ncbi:MAG: hypothetical protein V1728_00635 [Candidatus Micrarchaeota archaeon]
MANKKQGFESDGNQYVSASRTSASLGGNGCGRASGTGAGFGRNASGREASEGGNECGPVLSRRALLAVSFAFLFLFLAGCTASRPAPTPGNLISQKFYDFWHTGGAFPLLAYAGVALCLAMATLGLMYGYAVNDDMVKTWAKKEVLQAGFSVLIMLAAIGLIGAMDYYMTVLPASGPWSSASGTNFGGSTGVEWSAYVNADCARLMSNPITHQPAPELDRPCHIRVAEDYLQTLFAASQTHTADMLRQYSILAVFANFDKRSNGQTDPAGTLTLAPFVGLTMPVETLGFLIDVSIKNMMVIAFQQDALEYLHLAFFPIFFTLGIFLRSLFFTRRTGGLLIALALGFYVIFPMTYVFFYGAYYSMTAPWNTAPRDFDPNKIGMEAFSIKLNTQGKATVDGQMQIASMALPRVMPIAGTPTYSANCADGNLIYAGEECNKPARASLAGTNPPLPNDPYTRPMSCPPVDAGGNAIPGRENDIYCDTNACKCTSDPNIYGDFRQYVTTDPATRQAIVNQNAQIHMSLFDDPSLTAAQKERQNEQALEWMRLQDNDWFTKTYYDWGKAWGDARMSDQMLGFHGVFDNTAKLLVFSLLAPFIAVMVTLAGIKAFSPLLGGDVEIAGLTRII